MSRPSFDVEDSLLTPMRVCCGAKKLVSGRSFHHVSCEGDEDAHMGCSQGQQHHELLLRAAVHVRQE